MITLRFLKLRQPKNLTFGPVELEPNQSRKFMIILRITFCDKGPRRQVKKSPEVEKSILEYILSGLKMPLLMRPKLNRKRWKNSLRAVQKQRKEVDTQPFCM